MKLGLGLYRHMLDAENYRFAKQCGCTHVIAHLVDYFNRGEDAGQENQPVGDRSGWGRAGDPDKLWSVEELTALRQQVQAAGLELAAVENFDPAHWHDVLLDGPKKKQQLENIKTIVINAGRAGIPVIGYNFSLAGVAGRTKGPFARGDALSVGMQGLDETPIPRGMVWNMVYDPEAPPGTIETVGSEVLWQRFREFLDAVLPVAETAGVTLAAHPDDPPVPGLRAQPRLIYQPRLYQRLLDLRPSPRNALEFCVGSLSEMTEGNIYEVVDHYSRLGKIAYVHLRNVRGKAPHYRETFVDDGDVDVARVLGILKKNGFDGVIIPDHTPQMSCRAPWHAGMAYALGYMRALLQQLEQRAA
ncbi:MAG TPA: mannonate dehydratase [Terriglobia bacterium]|nr:mannonate dehydratase [Terriglobia bacterium]